MGMKSKASGIKVLLLTLKVPQSFVAKPFRAVAFRSRKCDFQSARGRRYVKANGLLKAGR